MAAVLLTGHGGLEKLEYRTDVPIPRPAADEVLIQVGAAGVNNTDINTRIGWYSKGVTAETGAGGAAGFRPSTRRTRRGRALPCGSLASRVRMSAAGSSTWARGSRRGSHR